MSKAWCDIELEKLKVPLGCSEPIMEILAIIRKREAERFPNGQAARFSTPLSQEQIARIRGLKDVPMHELWLDDKFDRITYLAQWYSVLCRNHHLYAEMLARYLAAGGQEWTFWRDKAHDTVNSVPPEDFVFVGSDWHQPGAPLDR
jgi:hypothetical protein